MEIFRKCSVYFVCLITGLVYLYTSYFGLFPEFTQRGLLLAASLLIIFWSKPHKKGKRVTILDMILGIIGVVSVLHFVLTQWDFLMRGGEPVLQDLVFGGILILLLLEAARRSLGIALSLVSAVFIAYAFAGPAMLGILKHAGVQLDYLISSTAMTTEGIWGVPMQIAATYVIIFVIFTAFLQESGTGKFFIDLSCALFGKVRGGPAKVAVFGSAIFGTISGSALANVAGTGSITIPLMKRIGYRPEFAGAVEAAASTGGQIMPPIMGAAAFIMAEFLSISYWSVAKAAIIPAVLYFWAIYVMVDLEAGKYGMQNFSIDEMPPVRKTIREGWHLLLPLVILIFLMGVIQYSPMKSAFWAVMSTIAVSALGPSTRMSIQRMAKAVADGVNDVAGIAIACATAGIVISIINISGLGLNFSSLLIQIAGGNLFILLLMTAVASLILGMGLPATPCYVLLAILVAPALIQLGVNPLAAHLFVFYFGMISGLTPPVALAAYVGAGIAQANSMRTGWLSTRLGAAGFLLPFMFCYAPGYLLLGSFWDILLAFLSGAIGIYSLGCSFEGFIFRPAAFWERLVLFTAAVALIMPGLVTDLIGFGFVAIVLARNYLRVTGQRNLA